MRRPLPRKPPERVWLDARTAWPGPLDSARERRLACAPVHAQTGNDGHGRALATAMPSRCHVRSPAGRCASFARLVSTALTNCCVALCRRSAPYAAYTAPRRHSVSETAGAGHRNGGLAWWHTSGRPANSERQRPTAKLPATMHLDGETPLPSGSRDTAARRRCARHDAIREAQGSSSSHTGSASADGYAPLAHRCAPALFAGAATLL